MLLAYGACALQSGPDGDQPWPPVWYVGCSLRLLWLFLLFDSLGSHAIRKSRICYRASDDHSPARAHDPTPHGHALLSSTSRIPRASTTARSATLKETDPSFHGVSSDVTRRFHNAVRVMYRRDSASSGTAPGGGTGGHDAGEGLHEHLSLSDRTSGRGGCRQCLL